MVLAPLKHIYRKWKAFRDRETNVLYKVLYDQVHNLDQAREIGNQDTRNAFDRQWQELPEGRFLLSDPQFRNRVDEILSKEEIQIDRRWFKDKKVLDAGCGNGRWAYGLSKLGADLTCVDVNSSALKYTKEALREFQSDVKFIQSPIEELSNVLPPESFDLVFSWGVLHHCGSYTESLKNVCSLVKAGGIIYLYLYGRESLSIEQDLELFKVRVEYNILMTPEERKRFLLKKAKGDRNQMHVEHDIYAPLINRRFTFEEVSNQLTELGFTDICRTINHTEVFVRATKGESPHKNFFLEKKNPPYWFQEK